MFNRCEFIGNLGSDPEVKRMSNGDPVVNISIAVSEKWKSKDGERKERTEWVRCVLFNEHLCKLAETYLKKGSKVFIAGQLQTRKWQDQNGQDKYSTEIVLQRYRGELTLLDSKLDNQQSQSNPAQTSHQRPNDGGYGSPAGGMEDPIPFRQEWR